MIKITDKKEILRFIDDNIYSMDNRVVKYDTYVELYEMVDSLTDAGEMKTGIETTPYKNKPEVKHEADVYSKYDLTHKEIFSSLVDVDTVLLNMGDKLINEYGVNPNYVRNIVISLLDRLYIIRTALNKQHFESYDSKDEPVRHYSGG